MKLKKPIAPLKGNKYIGFKAKPENVNASKKKTTRKTKRK